MKPSTETESTSKNRGNKILVVDDDRDLATALVALFEAQGYTTAVAYDGDSGFAQARKFDPDLVVLDIMMPEMDGFEVCRVFKEIWGSDRPKILILSGVTAGVSVNIRRLIEQSLADSFMSKPYKTDELLSEIRLLLSQIKTR